MDRINRSRRDAQSHVSEKMIFHCSGTVKLKVGLRLPSASRGCLRGLNLRICSGWRRRRRNSHEDEFPFPAAAAAASARRPSVETAAATPLSARARVASPLRRSVRRSVGRGRRRFPFFIPSKECATFSKPTTDEGAEFAKGKGTPLLARSPPSHTALFDQSVSLSFLFRHLLLRLIPTEKQIKKSSFIGNLTRGASSRSFFFTLSTVRRPKVWWSSLVS